MKIMVHEVYRIYTWYIVEEQKEARARQYLKSFAKKPHAMVAL